MLRRIRVRRHRRGYSRVGDETTTSAGGGGGRNDNQQWPWFASSHLDDVVDVRRGGGTSTRRRTTSRRVRERYAVSAVVVDVDVETGRRRCRGGDLPKRALDEARARRNWMEEGRGRGTETRDIWIGRPAGIGDDGTIDRDGRTWRRRRGGGRDEHHQLRPGQCRAYGGRWARGGGG